MTIRLLLLSLAIIALSGVPGLFVKRRSQFGQIAAVSLSVLGSLAGGAALVNFWLMPDAASGIDFAWALPIGRFAIKIDDLAFIFLIPVFLVSALGSIYGLGYWRQRNHPRTAQRLYLCWGLMTASMAIVLLARDAILLLFAWEIMSLAAFFLVGTEENKAEVRRAAWIFLIASHLGTLCLFGCFALLRSASGSFDLWPSTLAGSSAGMATAIFVLGAVGFGVKAGLMPLHVWLPDAHANAPSHVSAILSGVLLKMGVYGIVRIGMLQPNPPVWWGGTLLVVGTISGILGIASAAGQRDFKKLLAYSSIENIGIITMGVGLALLGRSLGRPVWIALGLGGALLHVLNHSLFKPLLFMGGGAVAHATHTRQMDRLGGLGKVMPKTFVLVAIGAIAICGLPPLNGFVSELLIYVGMFHTVTETAGGQQWGWVAMSAPALALIGALALVAFVKLLGTVFCGNSRSAATFGAHDPGGAMLGPMVVLAAACAVIGLFPAALVGFLTRAICVWAPGADITPDTITGSVSLHWVGAIGITMLILTAAGITYLSWLRNHSPIRRAGTWDCGYARPSPRMQYTGSSFSEPIIQLFAWVLRPIRKPVPMPELFPPATNFDADLPDAVLERGLTPTFGAAERAAGWARVLQGGSVQAYLVYILAVLLLLLLFI
jgi:hydrogenase-4 component B